MQDDEIKSEGVEDNNPVIHTCNWAAIFEGSLHVWGELQYCPMCGIKLRSDNSENNSK